jgi:PAS domain S-box-containing protein
MRSQKPNILGNVHNLILENVPEIIYFVETNGDPTRGSVKFVSPSVEDIVGYRRDEFTKNPALWISIIHPDDAGAVRRATEEMFATKKRIPRQYRIRHKVTGEYIWIEDKPSLIVDRNGKITGYIGVAREAEREFRESEMKFRTLADTVPYAIVIYRDSKLLFANRRVEALSGYTWEEISSVGFLQLVHPDFRDFVKKRASARLRGESVPSRYELKILNRAGEERWVDITAGLIEYEGEPAGIATAFDITERKRTEDELQKISRAVQQTTDIVFITDKDGLIEYVNPAFEKTTGYRRQEVVGKTSRILKSGEHPASFYEHLWKTILDGLPFRAVLINKKKDGTTYFEEKTITPLRAADGTITHFVSTGKNVTEQTKAAELLRQSEKKQRLVLSSMHEIVYAIRFDEGNPLTGTVDFVNDPVEDILGFSAEEFRLNPRLWLESIHPEDIAAVRGSTEKLLTDKKPITRTYRIKHKHTSEYRWMEDHVVPMLATGENKVVGIFGVARDITDVMRVEEERLRLLQVLESSLNEIYMFDVESLRFTYVNDGARRNLGYSMDELRLLTPIDLKPEYTEETFRNMIRPLVLREKKVHVFETTHRRKDGTLYPVEVHLQFVEIVESQTFVAIIHDITERKRTQEQLLFQSSMLDQVRNAAIATDLDGKITYWNKFAERLYGWRAEDVLGKQANDLVVPPSGRTRTSEIRNQIDQTGYWEGEIEFQRKDGTIIPILVTSTLLKDSTGKATGRVGISTDITERKLTEIALHDSEKKYRELVDNLDEVIYEINSAGDVTFINPAIRRVSGYKPKQIVGKNLTDLIYQGDRDLLLKRLGELKQGKEYISEYRFISKSGEVRWIQTSSKAIKEGNNFIGARGTLVDITERKRTQEILQESENRYRDLVEHSQDLVCTHDLEGRILSANPWAAKVLGYEIDTILHMNIRDILAPEVRGGVDTYLAKIQKRGFANGRLPVQTAAGERRIWEYHNTLRTEGVATPIVRGMGRDITERKQAEEIVRMHTERLQALSKQLLEIQENERRSIARELHDEIGQTLTSLKILLEMSTKAKAENARESLQEALGLISSLIGRVRNLSLDLRPPALDDLGLVPAIRWHLLHRTEKMGIKAHFKAEPEEIDVSGEIKTACFRVAQEALTNVLKHSKPQSVEVQVMKRGANLELTVRDDGTGFDADSAFRRAAAGESFGLLGMQERVRLTGGTFVIRSEQGRGSEIQATFTNAFIPSL